MSAPVGHLPATLRENSSWTPRGSTPSNEKIFSERMTLIKKWYSAWNEQQRWTLLEYILHHLNDGHLITLHDLLHPIMPPADHDFTRTLPRHLCLHILSYLDPKSLCRASRVCWYWKYLSESNELWKLKCLRRGWFMPTPPNPYDTSAWKRHYIGCVLQMHWYPPELEQPPPEHEASEGDCTLEDLEAVEEDKPKHRVKRHQGSWVPHKPWVPPDRYPTDISKGTIYGSSLIDSRYLCFQPPPRQNSNLRPPARASTKSQQRYTMDQREDQADFPPALIHPTLLEKLRLGSNSGRQLSQQFSPSKAKSYVYQPERTLRSQVDRLQESTPFPKFPSLFEDGILQSWESKMGSNGSGDVSDQGESQLKNYLKPEGDNPRTELVTQPWSIPVSEEDALI